MSLQEATLQDNLVFGFIDSKPAMVLFAWLFVMIIPASVNLCCLLFTRLSAMVHNGSEHPSTATLFGILANLIIFIPISVVVGCMYYLTRDEGFFLMERIYEYMILIFCLEYASLRSSILDVSFRLRSNDLTQARSGAQSILLRETDKMSQMGLAKAITETAPLHFLQGFFVPVFWYLLLGAEAALASTLLIIISRAFSVKLETNQYFGQFNATLCKLVCAIPALVMSLMLLITTFDFKALSRSIDTMKFHPSRLSGLLIAFTAFHLNVSLGGPRIYQGMKIRYNRIGGTTDPAPVHIDRGYRMCRNAAWAFCIALAFFQIIKLLKLYL